ncbi:hypothetical protein VPH35_039347 [Triticum aestivum]
MKAGVSEALEAVERGLEEAVGGERGDDGVEGLGERGRLRVQEGVVEERHEVGGVGGRRQTRGHDGGQIVGGDEPGLVAGPADEREERGGVGGGEGVGGEEEECGVGLGGERGERGGEGRPRAVAERERGEAGRRGGARERVGGGAGKDGGVGARHSGARPGRGREDLPRLVQVVDRVYPFDARRRLGREPARRQRQGQRRRAAAEVGEPGAEEHICVVTLSSSRLFRSS